MGDEEHMEKGELRLRIIQDEYPLNPREEWDHFGTMICWHQQANLGDKTVNTGRYENMKHLLESEIEPYEGAVVIPLHLYEHGGMTMSTVAFGDPFDSGKVGFIFATVPTILKGLDLKSEAEITDEIREQVVKILEGEVEVYDHFLQGNIWIYLLEQEHTCTCCETTKTENVDSCGGFYGDNLEYTGIADHLSDEAKPLLEAAWMDRGAA